MRLYPFLIIACLCIVSKPVWAGPKDDVKALNLEKLNTEADDVDPFPVDATNLLYATNEGGRFEIRLSKRTSTAVAWPAGKSFVAAASYDCRSPFVFQSKTLFFATNRIPDKKFESLRNFDLQQQRGEAMPVAVLGISEKEDELFPWVTPTGKEFFFSRKTEEGWKLFIAAGPSPGPIGEAQPVGFAAGFHHAALTPNGLTMFLQGPLEDGRAGIFRSKRTSLSGKWSDPEPIKPLNTSNGKQGDLAPSLSPEGYRLFFVSDRAGGKGGLDIWTVLIRDLK